MAPALSSNSFFLKTAPQPRTSIKKKRLAVFANKAGSFPGFRLGKSAVDEESSQEETTGNSSPFRFDFGKLPDVASLVPVVTGTSAGLSSKRKDPGTVFVAGATGQAGVRISQTLLRQGFKVRAGVSNLGAAQDLARLAASYKIISNEESKRLNAVESNFKDAESLAKAIGNASKVVVTIGPGEDDPTTEVTISDALQVIQAAQLANVGHVAIIYDGSFLNLSTYNVLDGISSFFNTLFSRDQAVTIPEILQKLVETDLRYTLIKTKLTEDFLPESKFNIVVSAEGSTGADDYKVAKSQIASLVADVFSNTALAENKVVEVSTNPSAPPKSIDELFSVIPEDGRRQAYAEALAKAKAAEEAVLATKRAEEAAKKPREQESRATNLAEAAEEKAVTAGASFDSFLTQAKGISSGISWGNLSSQLKSAVQKSTEEEPNVKVATVRGQAKARSLPAQKALVKKPTLRSPSSKPKQVPKPEPKSESTKEVRKVFGGLFKQETIYVDDD